MKSLYIILPVIITFLACTENRNQLGPGNHSNDSSTLDTSNHTDTMGFDTFNIDTMNICNYFADSVKKLQNLPKSTKFIGSAFELTAFIDSTGCFHNNEDPDFYYRLSFLKEDTVWGDTLNLIGRTSRNDIYGRFNIPHEDSIFMEFLFSTDVAPSDWGLRFRRAIEYGNVFYAYTDSTLSLLNDSKKMLLFRQLNEQIAFFPN